MSKELDYMKDIQNILNTPNYVKIAELESNDPDKICTSKEEFLTYLKDSKTVDGITYLKQPTPKFISMSNLTTWLGGQASYGIAKLPSRDSFKYELIDGMKLVAFTLDKCNIPILMKELSASNEVNAFNSEHLEERQYVSYIYFEDDKDELLTLVDE